MLWFLVPLCKNRSGQTVQHDNPRNGEQLHLATTTNLRWADKGMEDGGICTNGVFPPEDRVHRPTQADSCCTDAGRMAWLVDCLSKVRKAQPSRVPGNCVQVCHRVALGPGLSQTMKSPKPCKEYHDPPHNNATHLSGKGQEKMSTVTISVQQWTEESRRSSKARKEMQYDN